MEGEWCADRLQPRPPRSCRRDAPDQVEQGLIACSVDGELAPGRAGTAPGAVVPRGGERYFFAAAFFGTAFFAAGFLAAGFFLAVFPLLGIAARASIS
ncbi:hypothetical protein SAMN05428950_102499 [Sphingomonas sp. OV641]|nr:hypothetical protein SAMN05428950_102499 [Sphingomonas sp. OV641]